MLKHLIFSFALVVGFTMFASEAYGCSCLMPEGPRSKLVGEARDAAHAVFSGKVVKITENPGAEKMQDQYIEVELRVTDVWKGTVSRNVTLRTGSNDGNCRFPFELNKTYLVYADNSTMYSQSEMLSTGICSRTSLITKGKADMRYLGPRKKPSKI